ncbi:hypothetical protein [Wolbachia endosymbiont of Mansonella perstans]|uniref:hypothetical protein n=1 Tax=Wolbachia endosymbiont of Mansonella perstans TaxID=229526 RepID=UPI001CE02811|nr:hypothetical protein [Wolbachia endosymbiont of Mansonella perstans]
MYIGCCRPTWGLKENIKILSKLVFKGKLDAHYNPGCGKETLESHFFFDYFHSTAEPHYEIGNEVYELIKNDECESTNAEQ